MSSQHGSLQFVNEGSTKRKEILAKFLDLLMFDQKFKMAKEDSSDLKGALKRMQDREYDEEIFEVEKELIYNEADTREKKECCDALRSDIDILKVEKTDLENKIQSVPAKIIDVDRAKANLSKFSEGLGNIRKENKGIQGQQEEKKELLTKITAFLGEFDIEAYNDKKELIKSKGKDLELIQIEIDQQELKEKMSKKKVSLLDEVPCGSEFRIASSLRMLIQPKKMLKPLCWPWKLYKPEKSKQKVK